MSWRDNLSALQERLKGAPSLPIRRSRRTSSDQRSDFSLQKLTQLLNRCLDFSLRKILVELTDENAPEFFRGGEVAGAGFVLKSVAEDNGGLGHTRIYRLPPQSIRAETRRSNSRRISQAKSERVRRTWIPTTSLVTYPTPTHLLRAAVVIFRSSGILY
jgi:hypothetical protein